MNIFYILLLGTVQGLTEFLPVSSTGHLIILERLFNLSPLQYGFSFDVALHLGTLIALLIYYRKMILTIIYGFFQHKTKLLTLLIIGTIPAVLIGLFFESLISTIIREPVVVAISLIIFSFVFYFAEKYSKQRLDLKQLTKNDSFVIGLFQALAFIPGASRSGITISGGLARNLIREQAAEFAFLLSIPIVTLASIKDIFNLIKSGNLTTNYLQTSILGMLVSACVGFLCIKYFLNYLRKHGLMPFIIYRIILGLFIIYLLKF